MRCQGALGQPVRAFLDRVLRQIDVRGVEVLARDQLLLLSRPSQTSFLARTVSAAVRCFTAESRSWRKRTPLTTMAEISANTATPLARTIPAVAGLRRIHLTSCSQGGAGRAWIGSCLNHRSSSCAKASAEL